MCFIGEGVSSHRGGSTMRSSDLDFVMGRARVWCALGYRVDRSRGPIFEQDWDRFAGKVRVS